MEIPCLTAVGNSLVQFKSRLRRSCQVYFVITELNPRGNSMLDCGWLFSGSTQAWEHVSTSILLLQSFALSRFVITGFNLSRFVTTGFTLSRFVTTGFTLSCFVTTGFSFVSLCYYRLQFHFMSFHFILFTICQLNTGSLVSAFRLPGVAMIEPLLILPQPAIA